MKTLHYKILNDHEALRKEQEGNEEIPVFRKLDNSMVQSNYLQIKQDIQDIVDAEMTRPLNDPALKNLIVEKPNREP